MSKVIAFYNNKGGVAKTTTATNDAGVLSLKKKKVLLIDGDPQGHTSLTFGVDSDELQTTLGAYLTSNWSAKKASKYFIKVNDYLDVIPSNQSLSDFIIAVSSEEPKTRNKHLKNFIESVKNDYDYIIFDMAPAVDIVLENIVEIVDDLIVNVRYIVPTKTQLNTKTHKFMLENLREVAQAHNIKMTDTYIPNLIAFSEAVSIYELPLALIEDSRYKNAKKYYEKLVQELGY